MVEYYTTLDSGDNKNITNPTLCRLQINNDSNTINKQCFVAGKWRDIHSTPIEIQLMQEYLLNK